LIRQTTYNIIAIGPPGVGKSAFGNVLLCGDSGKTVFKSVNAPD
jgi:ATP-dependent Clp protease ATP-binding subunit ClpA